MPEKITLQHYLLIVGAGIFIGGVMARLISTWWLALPVGIVVGGSFSYVAVDFANFKRVVALAYQHTLAKLVDRAMWREVGESVITLLCFMVLVAMIPVDMHLKDFFKGSVPLYECLSAFSAAVAFFGCIFVMGFADDKFPGHERRVFYRRASLGWALALGNPIGLPISCVVLIVVAAIGVCRLLWRLIRFLPRVPGAIWGIIVALGAFVKLAFLYVHSELRTAVFINAALGIAAGYAVDASLVGVVLGVVIGISFAFASYTAVSRQSAVVPR